MESHGLSPVSYTHLAGKSKPERKDAVWHRRIFTKEMREKGTIVCPQMAPLQFQFLKQAFDPTGYHFKVLTEVTKEDIDVGLKYVNNDACYPDVYKRQVQRVPRSTGFCALSASCANSWMGIPNEKANVCRKLPHPEEHASFSMIPSTTPFLIRRHFISCPPISMIRSTS